MTYLPNEKELLRIHPQFLKIFSILLLTIAFFTLYLQWNDIIEHPFKMVDKLFFLLAGISCLFPRIILTTHRIIYRFGPFLAKKLKNLKSMILR